MNSLPYLFFPFLFILSSFTFAREAEVLFQEPDEVIWGFDFIDQNKMIYTTRSGKLKLLEMNTKKVVNLEAPKVQARGQGGLLHPEIIKVDQKKYLYLTYTTKSNGVLTTALGRALLDEKGKAQKFKELFSAKVKSDTTRHFGSRLASDGKSLFMSIGDRGERDYAQNLNYHNGKILRLNFDGTPFSENKSKGLKEIFSYGHRNPQGLFYDDERKILLSCEFGPRGGDELNLIKEGKNYGWPIITYGREYYGPKIGDTHKKGMMQPLAYWTPSISPSGMTVYRGEANPQWKGDIFLANLSSTHLRRIKLNKKNEVVEQEVLFGKLGERIRFVKEGPSGHLYFSTDNGKIYKLI